MSRSAKAHILLVLITFAWGSTFVLVKNALHDSSPLLLNGLRMAIAAVTLAIYFRKEFAGMTRASIRGGVIVGLFLGVGYACQTAGLTMTTPSKSAFLTGMSVVLVPVLLAVGWRKKVDRWTLVGVIAAFLGLYLLTVPGSSEGMFTLQGVNRGDVLTLGCAIAFAFQIILVGRAAAKHPFAHIVLLQIITCAVLNLAGAPLLERVHIVFSARVIWATLITSLICTAAAFTVQAWAQQFIPPTHTALIFALEPVFAWVTSFAVEGERMGLRAGLGAILILAGILASELLPSAGQAQAELVEETAE